MVETKRGPSLTTLANFQKLIDAIDYQKSDIERKYWLLCNDDWLQWRAATDIDELDTEDPKRPVGRIHKSTFPHCFLVSIVALYRAIDAFTSLLVQEKVDGEFEGSPKTA